MRSSTLTKREKIVVGVCLLVVLAAGITGVVVWLATTRNPSPKSSYRTALSSLPQQNGGQSSASQQQGQDQSQRRSSGQSDVTRSADQSKSTSQDTSGRPASNSPVAGQWVLDMQGTSSALPGLSVTLNQNGTVATSGAEANIFKLKDGRYSYDSSTRALKIQCDCEIPVSQGTTMAVELELSGTANAGPTEATGNFTATVSGTRADSGTFRLHH